jgi:hypothetical protein
MICIGSNSPRSGIALCWGPRTIKPNSKIADSGAIRGMDLPKPFCGRWMTFPSNHNIQN